MSLFQGLGVRAFLSRIGLQPGENSPQSPAGIAARGLGGATHIRCRVHFTIAVILAATGCRSARTIHDAEYAQLDSAATQTVQLANMEALESAKVPVLPELTGPRPVEEYIGFALSQSPRIQAARKRLEARGFRVPQAASLEDPMFGVNGYPFYPYVLQTAGGVSTYNLMASQKLPWPGKLEAQSQAAEAEVDMARAELAAAELEVIEQVKRTYFELYFVQRALSITEHSRDLLVQVSAVADVKYQNGTVSEQDLLRAQVEVSNVEAELIRIRQQLQGVRARLAQLLHVSPETPLLAVEQLPDEQLPEDLELLYAQAIAARPELHAQLAAIRRDRHRLDLARLQYFPDVTLNGMWGGMSTSGASSPVADGIGMFNLGAQVNVPLYRKKLAAGVHEAEAQTVSSAREYDALKDRTAAEIKDLFTMAISQRDLVKLFRSDIVPKSEQTLQVSFEAYRTGQTDFLQLLDNWRELLKFQIMLHQQESQLRQTLSTLERVVGGTVPFAGAANLRTLGTGTDVLQPQAIPNGSATSVIQPE